MCALTKQDLKRFAAGLAFPAVFLPIVYTFFYCCGPGAVNVKQPNVQFIPMWIPILFGLANIVYFWLSAHKLIKDKKLGLWLTGGILGFIVGCIGVYCFNVATLVFGLKGQDQYLPIFILPIIYGFVFRYIVNWFNELLGNK